MQLTSHRLLLGAGALLGAAVIVACGGDDDPPPADPTLAPRYTCVEPIPTPLEVGGLPTPENFPIPTVDAEPTVTASGLRILDAQVGEGDAAQRGGVVHINYKQWVEGGNQCDANHLAPVRIRLTEGQHVPGLIEGIVGMRAGGRRVIVIPPELGYGDRGSGNVIPPGATLVYEIELVEVSNPA